MRAQTPNCGEVLPIALVITGLTISSSLAVERWGMIAFMLILAAMVATVFGLVATGWMRRNGEGT